MRLPIGPAMAAPSLAAAAAVTAVVLAERLDKKPSGAVPSAAPPATHGSVRDFHLNSPAKRGESFVIPAGKRDVYRVMTKETVKVTCDVHPSSSAPVIARRDPCIAVTDEAGRCAIENVPPGRYPVAVWQETVGKSGARSAEVEFRAGERAACDVEVRPRG